MKPILYFRKLVSGDAKGIFQSNEQGMHYMGMGDNWTQKLVGFGTDGAAVNLAEGGLKGQLKQAAPWMEMVWCLAHRPELHVALKDALKIHSSALLMRCFYGCIFCMKITRRSVGN